MNRAVKWALDDLTVESAGKALLIIVKYQPQGYSSFKEYYFSKDEIADPLPMIKYAIRLCYIFGSDSREATLEELKKPQDPYRSVSFRWFNGRFAYDCKREVYRPVKITTTGSETMRNIWAKVEPRRIRRTWDKARRLLQGKGKKKPKLALESE